MSGVEKVLHVRLSLEQTRRLHEWAMAWTAHEVEAGCEPSGFRLDITMGGGIPPIAEAIGVGGCLELGEVDVVMVGQY